MRPFVAGQRWSYRTRPTEPGSALVSLKAEEFATGVVVSIRVEDVRLANPFIDGGVQSDLPHAPLKEEALRASVISLLGDAEDIPTDDVAYRQWRAAWDAGDASAFTVSVAEIITMLEETIADG